VITANTARPADSLTKDTLDDNFRKDSGRNTQYAYDSTAASFICGCVANTATTVD